MLVCISRVPGHLQSTVTQHVASKPHAILRGKTGRQESLSPEIRDHRPQSPCDLPRATATLRAGAVPPPAFAGVREDSCPLEQACPRGPPSPGPSRKPGQTPRSDLVPSLPRAGTASHLHAVGCAPGRDGMRPPFSCWFYEHVFLVMSDFKGRARREDHGQTHIRDACSFLRAERGGANTCLISP